MTSIAPSPARTRPRPLRARDVADLTVTSGYPCISVLLPTEPARRMTAADVDRLRALLTEVHQQLEQHGVSGRARLMRKLTAAVDRAAGQPAELGLAIYVNLAVERVFQLPVAVAPRALVEGTFATRALLTALHRMPPHVLLMLQPTCAHLYQGADGRLRSVAHRDLFRGTGAPRLPRAGELAPEELSEDLTEGFLRAVDSMLGSYRAEHPSPLVLGGSPRLLDRFCATSRNLSRLAGRIAPARSETALDLARSSSEVVETYLRSRRDEALHHLRHAFRARPEAVARGMAECWRAVHHTDPGMLLVEEDYVSPGRPADFGIGEWLDRDREGLPEVHDLVDDLMEAVIMRGGQLALVESGDLAEHGRVALVARADV